MTPAHDPDDWEIGQRHSLSVINVMAPDGSISDKYGWDDATEPEARNLLGMDRFEAREAIVEWFRQESLLEEVRDYTHEVGHSYRSHVPIEPYLSDQWYIAVKQPIAHLAERFGEGLIEGTDVPVNSLAGLALKPLLDGRLRFIPERYAKTYQAWLENLRDWPISRQLWWGHRIPTWRMELNISSPGLNPSDFADPASIVRGAMRSLLHALRRSDIDFVVQNSETEEWVAYACFETPDGDDVLDKVGRFLFSVPGDGSAHKPGQPYPRVERVEGLTGVPGSVDFCREFQKHVH